MSLPCPCISIGVPVGNGKQTSPITNVIAAVILLAAVIVLACSSVGRAPV